MRIRLVLCLAVLGISLPVLAVAGPGILLLADQGQAEAEYHLGLMYLNGAGVAKNKKEAVKWLRKAADQDQAIGQRHRCQHGGVRLGIEGRIQAAGAHC